MSKKHIQYHVKCLYLNNFFLFEIKGTLWPKKRPRSNTGAGHEPGLIGIFLKILKFNLDLNLNFNFI